MREVMTDRYSRKIVFDSWYVAEDESKVACRWNEYVFILERDQVPAERWQLLLADIRAGRHPRSIHLDIPSHDQERFVGQVVLADAHVIQVRGTVLRVTKRDFEWVQAKRPIQAVLTADLPVNKRVDVVCTRGDGCQKK